MHTYTLTNTCVCVRVLSNNAACHFDEYNRMSYLSGGSLWIHTTYIVVKILSVDMHKNPVREIDGTYNMNWI